TVHTWTFTLSLHDALPIFAPQIIAAFVFGSLAKRSDTAVSDIDVLIVSDSLSCADVFSALEGVRERLGRAINPTVYSRREWTRRSEEHTSELQSQSNLVCR